MLGTLASGPDEELLNVKNEAGAEFLIKRLSIFHQSDHNSFRRLDNERSLLQNLDHPGVPNCLDSPELDGEKVLVFEKPGEIILADMIADRDFWDSVQSSCRLYLAHQLIDLTLFLHTDRQMAGNSEDILIIDYRPETITINESGQAGAGLLSSLKPAILHETVTRDLPFDYLAYAAPEQVISGGIPGISSSYYGLGALVFELVTGKTLFHKSTEEKFLLRRKSINLNPLVSDVEEDMSFLDQSVQNLLETKMEQRWPEIENLRSQIEQFLELNIADDARGSLVEAISGFNKSKNVLVEASEEEPFERISSIDV